MSCINPLIAFPVGYSEKGRMRYKPQKRDSYMSEWMHSKEYLNEKKLQTDDKVFYPIEVPCGKCIGCRLDYSRAWAIRCMMELKYHNQACFITLTYNDNQVPLNYISDPDTGAALPVMSLKKEELQLFWKRLRKELDKEDIKIRYFACGEYGEETFRPHYHAIVFGYKPDDCRLYRRNTDGHNYFISEKIANIWKKGNVLVADVNFNTCAYVARYTAKKVNNVGKEFYEAFNIEEPFLVMSRRPGIGWKYMEDHYDVFKGDKVYLSGPDPVDGAIPRGFIQKIRDSDPALFNQISERKNLKGSVYERSIRMSDSRSYEEILEANKITLLQKSRAFKRNRA